jgi:LysM repeat protein
VSAESLIKMVNRERVSHGLKALVVDPILMQTAQTTADIMAGTLMHGHIGDVRGRVMAVGYGAGDLPWATENFVVLPLGADSRILAAWADQTHQIPMVDPNYRHVGAGVAVVDDTVYYVLHAAYTSNKIYQPGMAGTQNVAIKNLVSEYMYPVLTVTPRPDGKIFHLVKSGQTLWGIAIAYNTHIKDIQLANNLPQSLEMVYNGQELIIPAAAGSQPTPRQTPTLTQMIVPTETPTRPATEQTDLPALTGSSAEMDVRNRQPVSADNASTIIRAGIAGGIAAGLLLILYGILSGKNKESGSRSNGI